LCQTGGPAAVHLGRGNGGRLAPVIRAMVIMPARPGIDTGGKWALGTQAKRPVPSLIIGSWRARFDSLLFRHAATIS